MKRGPHKRSANGLDIEIGQRLRLLRVERDLSQMELGDLLGVSFQQIQKYEKGTNRLSASTLFKVAKLLKTTPHELMGWDTKTAVLPTDLETYKLARAFIGLDEDMKGPVRLLINGLMRVS